MFIIMDIITISIVGIVMLTCIISYYTASLSTLPNDLSFLIVEELHEQFTLGFGCGRES